MSQGKQLTLAEKLKWITPACEMIRDKCKDEKIKEQLCHLLLMMQDSLDSKNIKGGDFYCYPYENCLFLQKKEPTVRHMYVLSSILKSRRYILGMSIPHLKVMCVYIQQTRKK